MAIPYKTKKELLKDISAMDGEVRDFESCRDEYHKARDKFERFLDSAPDAMLFVNSGGKIVLANARIGELFGYDRDEIIGKELEMLIPERYRTRHYEFVQKYFSKPKVRSMGSNVEIYARRKDGSVFPADISLSPIETDEGLLAAAAVRDISERKKAEELIEKNYMVQKVINAVLEISLKPVSLEEILEDILDHTLSIPHLALGGKGAIYIAEKEREELVLIAKQGFTEDSDIPCRRVPFGTCLCGTAVSEGKPVHSEMIDERHKVIKENIFPHGHYCIPIASDGETLGLLNVFIKQGHKSNHTEQDFLTAVANTLAGVIKHKNAEDEKERLTIELSEAEKFASLGRISANVAHEIRNPLTAVGGFARRLHKLVSEETKEREYTNLIVNEVDQLEEILRKVLTYARAGEPMKKNMKLRDVVDECIAIYRDIFEEKSIKIETLFNSEKEVAIDETQVREVIENLFSNAIDSMENGGKLTVSIGEDNVEGESYLTVAIRDTGTGIPEDKIDTIFEPFYSTKVKERGTGLGLPIVKKIVEDHGGLIRVESVPDEGTMFMLYFPTSEHDGSEMRK
jgi:PAS domain S-box-containing protein